MAWSDAAPTPDPSCSARVAEIHAALTNAPVKGPYVLVGLSIGALVARLYQQRYPGEVRGMVIVDHAFLDPVPEPDSNRDVAVPGLDSPPILISKTPIVLTVEDISNFNNLRSSSASCIARLCRSIPRCRRPKPRAPAWRRWVQKR